MERIVRIIDYGIYAACVVGLVASGAVAGWALVAFPAALSGAPASLANGTLVALALLGAVFVLRYRQLTYHAPPRGAELIRFAGCPRWMRIVCYTFMIIGVWFFACSAALELFSFIPKTTGIPIRVGGFGWVAFSFTLAQLVSVRTLANRAVKRTHDAANADNAGFVPTATDGQ